MTRTLINSSMHTPDDDPLARLLYCCTRALCSNRAWALPPWNTSHSKTIDNSANLQIARSTLRRRRFKCHDVRLDDTLDDT